MRKITLGLMLLIILAYGCLHMSHKYETQEEILNQNLFGKDSVQWLDDELKQEIYLYSEEVKGEFAEVQNEGSIFPSELITTLEKMVYQSLDSSLHKFNWEEMQESVYFKTMEELGADEFKLDQEGMFHFHMTDEQDNYVFVVTSGGSDGIVNVRLTNRINNEFNVISEFQTQNSGYGMVIQVDGDFYYIFLEYNYMLKNYDGVHVYKLGNNAELENIKIKYLPYNYIWQNIYNTSEGAELDPYIESIKGEITSDEYLENGKAEGATVYYGDEEAAENFIVPENEEQYFSNEYYSIDFANIGTPVYMRKSNLIPSSYRDIWHLRSKFYMQNIEDNSINELEQLEIGYSAPTQGEAALVQMWFKEIEEKVYTCCLYHVSDYNYVLNIFLLEGDKTTRIRTDMICPQRRFVLTEEEITDAEPMKEEPTREPYIAEEWAEAYAAYLDLEKYASSYTYSLIYVNEDDIPELVLDTGYAAGGCLILTYYEGEVDALQTKRRNFDYIESGNLLCNSDGNMGLYHDYVYTIIKGKWNCIARGENRDGIDEDGNMFFSYTWEGKEVEEEEYEKNLKEVFDKEQAVEPERYYILRDIRSILLSGDVESASHRYELIIEDMTWTQAKEVCESKGGYLVTITSQEELERIQKQILKEKKTGVFFWVGAKNSAQRGDWGYCWLEFGSDKSDYDMLSHYNALWGEFWQEREPSYNGYNEAGEEIRENCVWLHYQEDEGKCLLQDMPDDILKECPSYVGKIGYICEYSVPTAEEKWVTEDIRKQIEIYVNNREIWEDGLYAYGEEDGGCAWNDLDQDGRLELVTSMELGTGRFSYNEYYRITEDGKKVKAIDHVRGEYSQMDILSGVEVYLDEETGNLIFLGQDVCKPSGTETTYTESYFTYDGGEKLEETILRSDVWNGKEARYYYYVDQKEVSKEEWEACKDNFLKDKTLIRNGFYWSSALEQGNVATLQMSDEELQAFLERLYAAYMEYNHNY